MVTVMAAAELVPVHVTCGGTQIDRQTDGRLQKLVHTQVLIISVKAFCLFGIDIRRQIHATKSSTEATSVSRCRTVLDQPCAGAGLQRHA